MAEGASPSAIPSLRNPSLCNECGSNPWKYRCPGCSIRSCSLPCVNSHKKRTSCTGKRSYSEVVPLSQFDDKLLLSDYNLLEETKRVADSARRKISGFLGNFRFRLPAKLWNIQNAANRRRIRLLLFPGGMSKRQINKSRYDKRKNSIFWTIELRFHGTDVALVHHGVDEHGSLLSIFGKHLAPGPWNHKLRPFCEVQLDDLKLFLRKNPKGSKSPFRKLDIRAPIGAQFEDIMILEYPVIFVYLPSHDFDFEVETGRMPFIKKTMPFLTCDMPTPNGTSYKVEEVEEGGDDPSDTRITDLMVSKKSENANFGNTCFTKEITKTNNAVHFTNKQIPEETGEGFRCKKSEIPLDTRITDLVSKKSENANLPSNTCLTKEITKANSAVHFTKKQIPEVTDDSSQYKSCGKHHSAPTTNSLESADAGFYFEQEVRDAYSDLIGEMNPDDFLCLDGAYNDEDDDLGKASWYEMVESKMDDTEKIRDLELGQLTDDLEETEANESTEGRAVYQEEKRDNFFFYNEDPFCKMELEEGEIPYYLF